MLKMRNNQKKEKIFTKMKKLSPLSNLISRIADEKLILKNLRAQETFSKDISPFLETYTLLQKHSLRAIKE